MDTTNILVENYKNNPRHNYLFVRQDQHYNGIANFLIVKNFLKLIKIN